MELKSRESIRRRRTDFAGGFAGSLAGGGSAVVVLFSLGFSVDIDEGESEAESLMQEERLSFKSTEAVSEKPLLAALPLSAESLPGRPSRNSVSSKLIILWLLSNTRRACELRVSFSQVEFGKVKLFFGESETERERYH